MRAFSEDILLAAERLVYSNKNQRFRFFLNSIPKDVAHLTSNIDKKNVMSLIIFTKLNEMYLNKKGCSSCDHRLHRVLGFKDSSRLITFVNHLANKLTINGSI